MKQNTQQEDSKSKFKTMTRNARNWFARTFISPCDETRDNTATRWIKVLVSSFRKFLDDDCMTKASSIAYTTIVSLIPTLTVVLSIYSLFTKVKNQKEAFFDKISSFLLEHSLDVNIDPVFDAISSLVNNAGKIGIIGGVVMIFSATATLRSLERALNHIWRVKKQRPLFLKIVYYWSTLTLGPLFIVAGATIAARIGEYIPVSLLNFIIPFAFIWTMFFFIYMVIPNTRVPFKYAAVGSIFTSAVWVTFILLFIVYIRAFAKGTFAIYGTLVSIPLFLLLVYSSVLIVLYGAEVSFSLMHPDTHRQPAGTGVDEKRIRIYSGIEILMTIYGSFEKGSGPTQFNDLTARTRTGNDIVDYFTSLFLNQGLIIKLEDGAFMPAMSSRVVRISRVIEMTHSLNYTIPAGGKKTGAKKILTGLFAKLQRSNNALIGSLTLYELMNAA